MPAFSLCMIVKNEEKVLKRCLESVRGIFDEIIICDTGSTDATKKIAAEFTDKIYDFKWCDDFSAARNHAFSKSTSDYNMWLDADDILTDDNRKQLIDFKEKLNPETDIIMMPYCTVLNEDGSPAFSFYRERIVKNNSKFLFKGRVHEAITPSGTIIYSDITVHHKSIKTSYSKRNLMIYEKQLKDGEPFTPRDTFYYGRELYYHGFHEKCREILNSFLKSDGWTENKIEACKILAYSYLASGSTEDAVNALTQSFLYDTPRAEICCELGYIFKNADNLKSAVYWFHTALKADKKENLGFTSNDAHGFIPAIELAVCYDKIGDYKTAEHYNELAGIFKSNNASYLHNRDYFKSILTN